MEKQQHTVTRTRRKKPSGWCNLSCTCGWGTMVNGLGTAEATAREHLAEAANPTPAPIDLPPDPTGRNWALPQWPGQDEQDGQGDQPAGAA